MIDEVLDITNMNAAWEKVSAKKGAPGLDGISVARWERNWEENLRRLQHLVKTNTYYPGRPKRIVVRKKGGGVRELSLLNVSDKVLQRAVMNIVEPEFDRRFLPCNHGYRPKRSVATAIQQVLNYRDKGYTSVLDADIENCFESINQDILLERINRVIKDWHIINLMKLWLNIYRRKPKIPIGIPTGAVISPLWCNIYLHVLDARLTIARCKLVRYADDFLVFANNEQEIKKTKELIIDTLDYLHLSLAHDKTCETCFSIGFRFLGVDFINNSYRYTWEQKKININGRHIKTLYKYPPSYY